MSAYRSLSTYQATVAHIQENWNAFLQKRNSRLEQQRRHGAAAERVTENIIEDLFTMVLDWRIEDLNNQVEYADLILTSNGLKRLIIEAKRPGALAWNQSAVEIALEQARRYAAEQRVTSIAVSDGVMLYATDIQSSGYRDRVFVSLESSKAPEELWWLSQHGIYRRPENIDSSSPVLLPKAHDTSDQATSIIDEMLLHPKYKIPAHCFAYVGDASKTSTWKLPYRLADGSPDLKRLPKAIQSILSNYRGARVSSIPEKSIPDVLVCLAKMAVNLGRLPFQCGDTAETYRMLEEALIQLDRLDEVKN